jgi:hypothetical protein
MIRFMKPGGIYTPLPEIPIAYGPMRNNVFRSPTVISEFY